MMKNQFLPGVFSTTKRNGSVYFRAAITFHNKHISLGSFATEELAHFAYKEAHLILYSNITIEQYIDNSPLHFEKWVCLINFRENGIYIKNPIYLKPAYFLYYFSKDEYYIFDAEELFYFSEHKIMRRNGHLFVSDYGMQIRVLSRFGIKNYARPDVDFRYLNHNLYDLRAENIEIINPYIGVVKQQKKNKIDYLARLHIRSNYVIGRYDTEIKAAIAYNKAVDIVKANGCKKNFETNYIEELNAHQYIALYETCIVSKRIYELYFD